MQMRGVVEAVQVERRTPRDSLRHSREEEVEGEVLKRSGKKKKVSKSSHSKNKVSSGTPSDDNNDMLHMMGGHGQDASVRVSGQQHFDDPSWQVKQ